MEEGVEEEEEKEEKEEKIGKKKRKETCLTIYYLPKSKVALFIGDFVYVSSHLICDLY